jgi:hypothetical protein
MKLSLGELRQLIRERAHDTIVANTQAVPSSEDSLATHVGTIHDDSPLEAKVTAITKLFSRHGHNIDQKKLRKFLSGYDPKELLVKSAWDAAEDYVAATMN